MCVKQALDAIDHITLASETPKAYSQQPWKDVSGLICLRQNLLTAVSKAGRLEVAEGCCAH